MFDCTGMIKPETLVRLIIGAEVIVDDGADVVAEVVVALAVLIGPTLAVDAVLVLLAEVAMAGDDTGPLGILAEILVLL